MAKPSTKKSSQQLMMGRWWIRTLMALAFLGLAYGFISLALDSAHLWEYALGIIFVLYGVKQAITAIRFAFFT